MKTQHTPGPWTVRKDRRAAHPSTVMASCTAIAKCNEFVREVEANARLIAAAPELLAALIACERQLDRETLGGEALDAARAAISKASA